MKNNKKEEVTSDNKKLRQIIIETDGYNIKTNMDLRKIAIKELQEGKLPYIIKRPMPNGAPEYWPVSKLSLHTIDYMIR